MKQSPKTSTWEFTLVANDGTPLQGYVWQLKDREVRAVAVIVHGLRDHAARYTDLAERLNRDGVAVYATDHRGHGRSGGAHQYFDSVGQLVSDVLLTIDRARGAHPGRPVFLYGHSLGGLVAAHLALEHAAVLRGVVLSAPALQLLPSVSAVQQSLARFFGTYLPNLPAQPLDDRDFVRDPQAKAELAADPLVHHANLPARSARAGLDGIAAAQARMADFNLPFLVMHGTKDSATNIEGSRALYARARTTDKQLEIFEGVHHDLLHEPERGAVMERVAAWMLERV